MPAPTRRGALVFVFITVALDMIALGIVAPVLPKLIANFLGGDLARAAEYTGLFATVWAIGQFFCAPLLGMLSDRVGRRPVILLSNAVTVVDYAIMALAPSLWWLFAGRVLSGVATASISTAYAYIADVTAPAQRAAAYGMLASAFGLGFIIGPAIGGLAGSVDPRLPFWIAAAFSLLNTCYGLFVLRESLAPELRSRAIAWKRANPLGALALLRRHPELSGLSWVTFIALVAHEAMPNLWVLYCIAQFRWNERTIGLALALVGVVSSLNAALLVGPVVKRLGERRTLLAGLATFAIGCALFASTQVWIAIGGIVVLCLAIYNAPLQSLMSQRVAPGEQGELQGAIGSLRGVAMSVSPAIFALTFAQFTGPWQGLNLRGAPFYLAALMLIAALAVAFKVTNRADDVVLPLPQAAPPTVLEG